ncbi:hypothetical protein M0812_04636 [Anaeramoeba flamelloides]|uniref:Protein YIP n=1 Tax=Anaeramoeba flamelloides TaxID=1746091 RepID=A0AAV8AF03_9EUKA|nr:hypothetical protein M0812_04636 [Anaeramoeba flamelloides]
MSNQSNELSFSSPFDQEENENQQENEFGSFISSGNEFIESNSHSPKQMKGFGNNSQNLSDDLNIPDFNPELELNENFDPLDENAPNQKRKKQPFWTLSYYEQYFDVETGDVLKNVILSCHPVKGVSLEKLDLFGPFWVTTTLIFLMGSLGNFSSYINSLKKQEEEVGDWEFDFRKITTASILLYSYVFVYPIAVHFIFKFVSKIEIKIFALICIFGYSLSAFLPASILFAVPSEKSKWLLLIFVSCVTMLAILSSLNNNYNTENSHKIQFYVLLGGIGVVHFIISILIKIWFFEGN